MSLTKPTLAVVVLLLALHGFDASAQERRGDGPGRHGPPGATEQLARLEHALELSDEQSLRLLEVLQQAETQREALHAQAFEQLKPEICALHASTEAEIIAVLDADQAERFQSLKAERQQKFAERGGRRRGADWPDCAEDG